MKKNLILTLDSYKQLHGEMLPEGTEHVYSYCEARTGAMYPYTIFFGLQYILKEWLDGKALTKEMVDEAEPIMKAHFEFNGDVWDRSKWDYIIKTHGGKLPIEIRAIPEGAKIGISNALYTITNTDRKCAWLTNALETLLQQVWYPTTVATRAHYIMGIIKDYFKATVDDENQWLAEFYLHSFGQRACAGMEQAGIGGAAELVAIKGTDTLMGLKYAVDYYGADYNHFKSVAASEHSIMCALGKEGEFEVVKNLIQKFPNGILSVVSDTYDIENAVNTYCTELKDLILSRNGKFVVRPDSPRFEGDTPEDQVLWIVQRLEEGFGTAINSKGYKVLNPKVGCIYGDSLTEHDIHNILYKLKTHGYSAECCVFGCGGYLLDKLNRDTQRFAVKASANYRDGEWHDIYKEPRDKSKASKKGLLKVIKSGIDYTTVSKTGGEDCLELVFKNGKIIKEYNFNEIRERAKL